MSEFNRDVWNQARDLIYKASKGADPRVMQRLDELVIHTDGVVGDCIDEPECGIIILGDWNSIYGETEDGGVEKTDNTMPELSEALEKLGIELGWNDCYEVCESCGRLIGTQPTHYGWLPEHASVPDVGEYVCVECIVEDHVEEYLEGLEGQDGKAVTISEIDPTEHGYRVIIGECENGWYGGQDDDPKDIGKALRKLGITRYLFKIDSTGQFDIHFSVYVHKSERRKFNRNRYEAALVKGPDPAQVMQACLRDSARAEAQARAEAGNKPGPVVIQPDPNNPDRAVARVVSPIDWVEGRALER